MNSLIEIEPLDDIVHEHATWIGGHDVGFTQRDGLITVLRDPRVHRNINVGVTHEFPMSRAEEALIQAGITRQCGKIYLRRTL